MITTVAGIDLEKLCDWGKPKEVSTAKGPRILRTGEPSQAFWIAWRAQKKQLQDAGISASQYKDKWQCCWWQLLPQAELDKRAVSLEGSRAMDAEIDVPAPPGLEYRGYQKAGIAYMASRSGNYLGDEMGTGKTIQIVGLINYDKNIHRVLIFTKLRLKWNWYLELKKWLTKPLSVGIADGKCFPTTDVVIIHYDVAHRWKKKLEFYWDLVVMDEAHLIKNPKTIRAKAILGYKPTRKEIAEGVEASSGIPAKKRVALSGTPIENRVQEIFSVINYLCPEKFPSRWKFERDYLNAGTINGHWTISGPKNLEKLQQVLRETCLLRRLKRDVLKDLPPKVRIVVELEADTDEIKQQVKAVWEKYSEREDDIIQIQAELELAKTVDTGDEYTAQIQTLRSRSGVPFSEIARERHREAVAKIPLVLEAIKEDMEEVGPKMLIFFHHSDVGHALKAHFPKAVLVNGETKPAESHALVQKFMNDPECGPFFGSIRATGEGLNLTVASYVGFVEEDPVPGKMEQCADRAHRFGQKDTVVVKHFVVNGSLDANNIKLQIEKQEIADKTLDETTRQEILADPQLANGHRSLGTRKQIEIEASIITEEQRRAVMESLMVVKCASKVDERVCQMLCRGDMLTDKQTVLGRKLLFRYRQQIQDDQLKKMGGNQPWRQTD